jgi:hypothetical protein
LIETTGSEEVLEVGSILRRGLRFGNDILESNVVVREIVDQVIAEKFQVISESHVVLESGSDWKHLGEETDNLLKLSHRTLGDSGTNDERVLSRVLVEE